MRKLYMVIQSLNDSDFDDDINRAANEGYTILKLSTCAVASGIHYTAVMKLKDSEYLADRDPAVQQSRNA